MTARRPILVVNADDFGLTPGVCTGILRAHRDGLATSTSALVVAPAFEPFAEALRADNLCAGIHLSAVGEDPPLSPPGSIPTLVDESGRFPLTWQGFVGRSLTGKVRAEHLRVEFSAQIERLRDHGIRPTHLDTHQNLHLWPAVTSVVVDLATRHRIPVIRITRSRRWTPVPLTVRGLGRLARVRSERAGLVVPPSADGLDDAGNMGIDKMLAAVERLGRSGRDADLTVHPGEAMDPDRDRYRWHYNWPQELEALCSADLRAQVDRSGFQLGSFAELAGNDTGL